MKLFLRVTFFCAFLISYQSELYAQGNYGSHVSGIQAVIKTEAIIKADENRLSLLQTPGEGEEIKLNRSGQNPLAPAIARYPIPQTNTPASITGVNLSVHSNFLASDIADGGSVSYYPPDCNGDISTASQIITTTNGRIKVYNVPTVNSAALTTTQGSSGTPLTGAILNLSSDAFFANAGLGITKTTDTHVRFDRLSGRWFIIAQDGTHTVNNYLMIAVSNTTILTAASTFSIYYMHGTSGATAATDWFDFPTLGIDKYALYIGGNIFWPAHGTRGSTIFVVNKASLLAGSLSATVWQYGTGPGTTGTGGSLGICTPQGVQNDDPAATTGYFIGVDWAGFSKLIIKTITNPGTASPTLSSDIELTVPVTVFPIEQPSLGSTGLDAFDDRLFAAMMMKNKLTGISSLWTAQNIEVNSSGVGTTGGGRNGSRWYEITDLNTTPVLNQAGTLFDPAATNPRGYWMPSIAMNGQGHALLGSSTSAANRRAQVSIASRYFSDAGGTLQLPDTVTKATNGYSPAFDRWGDYSQTVVDPKNNMTFWTFQEYTSQTNEWGLRAVQVKAPPPAQNIIVSGTPANFCGAAVNLTLTGSTTNNEGFFDPGNDVGGPGFDRLTVSCTGGITVSNIVFVSSNTITCTLNTINKIAGTYTITVTNPDGQFVTVPFTLTASCLTVVPITFNGFKAYRQNDVVIIEWKAANESGLKWYEIERSSDGINFYRIAIKSALNTDPAAYNWNDINPLDGESYYRIRSVDMDGKILVSEIVKVSWKAGFKGIQVFPNPGHGLFNIKLNAEKSQKVIVVIMDAQGKKIKEIEMNIIKGVNERKIQLNGMPAGEYLLNINDAAGTMLWKIKLIKN